MSTYTNAPLEEVIKDLLYLMHVEENGPQPDLGKDSGPHDRWLQNLEVDADYWVKQYLRHHEALGSGAEKA